MRCSKDALPTYNDLLLVGSAFLFLALTACATTPPSSVTDQAFASLRKRVEMLEQTVSELRAAEALREATPNDNLPLCIDTE